MDRTENRLSPALDHRNDSVKPAADSTARTALPKIASVECNFPTETHAGDRRLTGPAASAAGTGTPPRVGTAEWLAWRTREREAALAAAVARNRAAPPPGGFQAPRTAGSIAAAAIAANGATSIRDIERTRPAGNALPLHVQTLTGARVCHPKIWERDLSPTGIRPDFDRWLRSSRTCARARVPGDVRAPAIVRVAEIIVWEARKRGTGFARLTFQQIGRMAMVCARTALDAVRFLERSRLLDTFNVLARDEKTGEHRRGANLYFLAAPAGAASPAWSEPPAPASVTIPDLVADRLRRYADALRLQARAWGFNAPAAEPPSPRRRRPPD